MHDFDLVAFANAVFLDQHVIGALRHGRPGEDAGGLMIADLASPRHAGARFSDHLELGVHRHIGETDGIAIHGRNVGGGLVDLRHHRFGEAAAIGGGEGDSFNAKSAVAGMGRDQGKRLLDGGHADHQVSFSLSL